MLSVGLIPENELTQGLDIEMDPVTRGPVVDAGTYSDLGSGIFAAGNAVAVFGLVDYVSETGVCAARGAVKFIRSDARTVKPIPTVAGENVLYVLPRRRRAGERHRGPVHACAAPAAGRGAVTASAGAETLLNKRYPVVAPPEMVHVRLQGETAGAGSMRIDIPRRLCRMMERTFTCIVCPKSCRVTLRESGADLSVTGNGCARGRSTRETNIQIPCG